MDDQSDIDQIDQERSLAERMVCVGQIEYKEQTRFTQLDQGKERCLRKSAPLRDG